MTDWIVLKFGGTSVARRDGWETIGRLMRQRHDDEGANARASSRASPRSIGGSMR